MVDLSVDLCGIHLPNPLVLASGPLSWNARAIGAALDAGAAAVVTKTIRNEASVNPIPHIAQAGRRSMLNTEGWSDLPAEQWIEMELPWIANRPGVVIASTGHTPEEVARLAAPLAGTGVDCLELVSYDAQDAAPMVFAAKQTVSIPILVKLSANWPGLQDVVDDCARAGADGFTAIDSVGPALAIDVESGRPLLDSFAWLSGEAIRPIALRTVADVCLHHDVPVIGTGGVGRAEDAVEMIMAGATLVGAHTAPLLKGLSWFQSTLRGLRRWLERRGVQHLSDLRSSALPHLQAGASQSRLAFKFDAASCSRCGRCVTVCAYGARTLTADTQMRLDRALCRSCGLCVSVCPTDALTLA